VSSPATPTRPASRNTGGSPGGRRDLGLLVVLSVIWGSAFPVIRLGLLAGASPLVFGAARFAIAGAVMAAITVATRAARPDLRTLLGSALFGGALTIGAYAAFLYSGEQTVSGGLSSVLVATVPLWTALLGAAILTDERLNWLAGIGLLAGFAGVLVVFLPDVIAGGGDPRGEAMVLGAALSTSIGSVLVRRFVPAPPTMWGLTTEFGTAAALLAVFSLGPGVGASLPLNDATAGSLAYLAIGPSVVGYAIYFHLLHRGGPTRATLVAYLNPLTGITLGIVLLGENLSVSEVAGFLLIVAGVLLFQRERARVPVAGPVPTSTSRRTAGP